MELTDLGVVAIGRNEGQRLVRCLESLAAFIPTKQLVYVDSGSSDDSVAAATARSIATVSLDRARPMSAARGRNAGAAWVQEHLKVGAILFIDGDCEVKEDFVRSALALLKSDHLVGAVCGYRTERFPEKSVFNRLCDVEWRSPEPGPTRSFGGDVLVRASTFMSAGGYREDVIAGEDEEFAARVCDTGARVMRIDLVSTVHDVDMHRVSQWWKRAERAGHAYAQVWELRRNIDGKFDKEVRRIVLSAVAMGAAIGLMPVTLGLSGTLLALPAVQCARASVAARRRGFSTRTAVEWGTSCAVSKIPEAVGVWSYAMTRFSKKVPVIKEYK